MSIKYEIVELDKGHYVKMLKCFSEHEKPESKKNTLIVLIPGNPGIIEFYEYFAIQLNKLTQLPVVGISFTGHLYDETGRIQSWSPLTVSEQISDKLQHIETRLLNDAEISSQLSSVESAKLKFVGHSIGCYTILELLSQLSVDVKERVSHAYLLTPTVERMRETPNGRALTFVARYLAWLVYLFAFLVTLLPRLAKEFLVDRFTKYDFHGDDNLVDELRTIIINIGSTYSCMRSCFFMGCDEMRRVRQANRKSIEENLPILTFYYGTKDKWCPFEYYVEMKEFVDELEDKANNNNNNKTATKTCPTVILDDNDIDHAFVVFKSQCDYLANLINDYL